MLEQFILLFTKEKIEYTRQGNWFYFIPSHLKEYSVFPDPVSRGLFLGEIRNKFFFPALPLLSWLSSRTTRKMKVTDKAAWLFLCGRDINNESVIGKIIKSGLILVQNKYDENLGYGLVTKNGVKNLLDRGDYLRRERKSSKAR